MFIYLKNILSFRVFIILAILNLFYFSLYGQIDKSLIKNTWIATYCKQQGFDKFLPSYKGIYSFNNNKAEIFYIGIDSIEIFNYEIENDCIYKNDSIKLGQIKHLSLDSLLILTEDKTLTIFKPIKHYKLNTNVEEITNFLLKTAINEVFDGNQHRIDFLNSHFYPGEYKTIKECIVHLKNKYGSYKNYEKWAVSEYRGQIFIIISRGQFDYNTYQIKSFDKQSIISEIISPFNHVPFLFCDIDLARKTKIDSLKQLLISKNWVMAEVEYYHKDKAAAEKYNYDVNESYGTCIHEEDANKMILKKDLIDKMLVYNFFKSGKFSIYYYSENSKYGTWKLTDDGKYIVLKEESEYPLDYIEIIDVTNNQITIWHTMDLRVSINSKEYVTYNCKIILK